MQIDRASYHAFWQFRDLKSTQIVPHTHEHTPCGAVAKLVEKLDDLCALSYTAHHQSEL